jgi:hypothetical protein
LAERSVLVGKGFWMREVRRLCDSGRQTSVMTTRQDLTAEQIAAKWSQKNFFRLCATNTTWIIGSLMVLKKPMAIVWGFVRDIK